MSLKLIKIKLKRKEAPNFDLRLSSYHQDQTKSNF